MRQNTQRIMAGVLAALIVVAGGIGVASATGDDNDTPLTGAALDRASAAALAYVGAGQVSDTEVGDEEGYYEIEVTRDNGQQVDVHLDETFTVLGQEADSDEGDD
jgi:hypothetical protein